jgi:hypothetical protein
MSCARSIGSNQLALCVGVANAIRRIVQQGRRRDALAQLIMAAFFGVGAVPSAQAAVVGGGTFTRIMLSSTDLTPHSTAPTINNHGQLAFLVNDHRFGGLSRTTVFVGDGSSLMAVDGGQGINGIVGPVPYTNDFGAVIYNANLTTETRVVFSNRPAARTQVITGEAFGAAGTNDSFGAARVNNAGQVAFSASANDVPLSNGAMRIITGQLNPAETGYTTQTAFQTDTVNNQGHFFSMYDPDMNSSGVLAFTGQDAQQRSGLFIGTSQQDYAAVKGGTAAGTFVLNNILTGKTPAINDAGDTAFLATTMNGRLGIFLRDADGTVAPVVTSADMWSTGFHQFHSVGLNNAGDIAFHGSLGADAFQATRGIFAGENFHKIIGLGDTLEGKTVTDIQFAEAINDAGQIGFHATLKDSNNNFTTGIFRYEPPAGSSASNPLMPDQVVSGGFGFTITVAAGDFGLGRSLPMFFDPVVAVGYEYDVSGGPNFQSVLLPPGIGNNLFDLDLWNGSAYEFWQTLTGGVDYLLPSAVTRFRVRGIEAAAGLDPDDPNAFVTGLTFDGGGQINVTMTPITLDTDTNFTTPEPASALMMSVGFLVLAAGTMKRRRASFLACSRK